MPGLLDLASGWLTDKLNATCGHGYIEKGIVTQVLKEFPKWRPSDEEILMSQQLAAYRVNVTGDGALFGLVAAGAIHTLFLRGRKGNRTWVPKLMTYMIVPMIAGGVSSFVSITTTMEHWAAHGGPPRADGIPRREKFSFMAETIRIKMAKGGDPAMRKKFPVTPKEVVEREYGLLVRELESKGLLRR
jgi:hypothetical protein